MAEIKGALLKAWVKFLMNRYGEQPVTQALATMGPEDQRLLSAPVLDSSWYPYETLHALRRLTRPLATATDRDLAREIGSYMAQYTFTGVYRSLLVSDPIKQVEKFSWISEFFFRETRKLETEIKGPSACLVRYRYEQGARPTRAICASLAGFWSHTLELAGASHLKAAHPKCVTKGDDCCEFSFDWTPPGK